MDGRSLSLARPRWATRSTGWQSPALHSDTERPGRRPRQLAWAWQPSRCRLHSHVIGRGCVKRQLVAAVQTCARCAFSTAARWCGSGPSNGSRGPLSAWPWASVGRPLARSTGTSDYDTLICCAVLGALQTWTPGVSQKSVKQKPPPVAMSRLGAYLWGLTQDWVCAGSR